MDKLKKMFSPDKEPAAEAERTGRKVSTDNRNFSGNTTSNTGLTSNVPGNSSSSYGNEGSSGIASSAEKKLTGNTSGTSGSTSQDINRPFAKDDPVSASGTSTSRTGADTTSGYSGASEAAYSSQPTTTEYNSSGLTGTALADRSVGTSGSSGAYGSSHSHTAYDSSQRQSGGPHPTFTGSSLDPAFTEDIPSYHQENVHPQALTSSGTAPLGPTGMAATYIVSGAEAEQYLKSASNISTAGYSSQSQPTSGYTGSSGYTSSTAGTYTGATSGGSQGSATGPASSTAGPHKSNLMNVVDPRVQPDSGTLRGQESSTSDTYGRNAAIAGGAGAAGATGASAYESSKPSAVSRYEEDRGVSEGQSYSRTGGTAGAAGVDSSDYGVHEDLERHEALEDEHRRASKGGPLGFLHASQKDKYDDPEARDTTAKNKYFAQHARSSGESERSTSKTTGSSHLGRDAAAVGTAGGLGGAAAYEYGKHSGSTGGPLGKTEAADYDPYSSQHAPTAATSSVGKTTQTGYDPYAKESSTGPAGFATGLKGHSGSGSAVGTGAGVVATTAAATHATTESTTPEKKHTFGFLHRKDPNKLHKDQTSGGVDDAGDGRVIDSITGLPMNVAKYGPGTGGTDGLKSIHGYEQGLNRERLASEGTADYEAMKKANVPY